MRADSGRRVLVFNAGSSSLKFALFEEHARLWHGQMRHRDSFGHEGLLRVL